MFPVRSFGPFRGWGSGQAGRSSGSQARPWSGNGLVRRRGGAGAAWAWLIQIACSPPSSATTPQPPQGPLDLEAARAYVLQLVNTERLAQGLPSVELDVSAERAGQEHAEDMAELGFTAHWGSDGSVPEERYTRAGGQHFVQENAACFFDGEARPLDAEPRFSVSLLEQIEAAFLAEVPPHDGHRRNILKPTHTGLGIGLAQPAGLAQPCMAQEFVDARGRYEPLPSTARVGQMLHIAGELTEAVQFGGVGLSRIEPRKPLGVQHLNATSSYPIPAPYQTYFPEGYQTPKPVALTGRRFSIDVPVSDRKRPGRYGVSIWGIYPNSGDQLVMVSLRIVAVQ
ncbi:MAG TPA: CAP domain-containing protein [Polyangiaceae bacterium]|nr:CAP domain-containing protein [Polyangiaceae bacterium]